MLRLFETALKMAQTADANELTFAFLDQVLKIVKVMVVAAIEAQKPREDHKSAEPQQDE